MKRKHCNDRHNLPGDSNAPTELQMRVTEMAGHLELGLHAEALNAARAVFKHDELGANAFNESVNVVLIAENNLKRWTKIIQAAYNRFSKGEQKKVADSMAAYYSTIRDFETAAAFVRTNSSDPGTLSINMTTLLELRDLGSAKILFTRCRRLLNKTHTSFERSILLSAMAEYCQMFGDLSSAEICWIEASELDEPFLKTALSGLVKIQVMRALLHVEKGVKQIKKFWKQDHDESAIMLPGNHDALLADAKKELEGFRAKLHKIVPPQDRWRYGVKPEGSGE